MFAIFMLKNCDFLYKNMKENSQYIFSHGLGLGSLSTWSISVNLRSLNVFIFSLIELKGKICTSFKA